MWIYLASTRVSAIYAWCIWRFLYTLSRVEISVYAVYLDTCGSLYRYIFLYMLPSQYQNQSFSVRDFSKCSVDYYPLRCPDTNWIRVVIVYDSYTLRTCGCRYFFICIKKFADTKISGYVLTGPQSDVLYCR